MRIRNVIKILYTFRRIVDALDDDLTEPGVYTLLLQFRKEVIHRFLFASGIFFIIIGVAHFVIKQAKIGHVKQLFDLFIPYAPRSVERGMDSDRFAKLKKLADEIGLRTRFTTRNGYAAVLAEIFAVTLDLFEYLFCAHFFSTREIPGIGIVAICATERTALHKKHKTHAGTVNGPERLYRIDPTRHITDSRGRYG